MQPNECVLISRQCALFLPDSGCLILTKRFKLKFASRLCYLGLPFCFQLLSGWFRSRRSFLVLCQSFFAFYSHPSALTVSIHQLHSALHLLSRLPGFSIIPFPDIMPHSPASLLSLKLSQFLLTALNVSWFFVLDPLGRPCAIILILQQIDAHGWAPHVSSFLSSSELSPPSLSPLLIRILTEAVHHVSVSINVSHSSLVCGEAWGTDPHFSWLYERVAITKTVGSVSKDGTTLLVTMTPFCGHFTCVVSNKLGYSSATYTAGASSFYTKRITLFLEYSLQ